MVQGKKLKQKHSLDDVDSGAHEYDDVTGLQTWFQASESEEPGPCHEGGGEGPHTRSGDGGGPRAVDKATADIGPSEDTLWYVVCLETRNKRHIKEVRVGAGHRITFGPMATGGRFPACWRVYDGKELIFALTGVVWFHRRDFTVRDYGEA